MGVALLSGGLVLAPLAARSRPAAPLRGMPGCVQSEALYSAESCIKYHNIDRVCDIDNMITYRLF
jgi:hypothetical protein